MEYIKNNPVTNLAATIDASQTEFDVAFASVFPSPNFRILVDDEIMLVTDVTSDTLTVERGAESTTAASHSINTYVKGVLTAEGLTQFINEKITAAALFSRTGTVISPVTANDSLNLGTGTLLGGKIGLGTGATTPATAFHLSGKTSADYAQIDTGINLNQVSPASTLITATLTATAGVVTDGNHRYAVTFVTDLGETSMVVKSDVVTVTGTKQVALTNIPVSSDYRVKARNIYRTIATSADYHFKFLYQIPDNETTTYTDNKADASLTGGATYPGYWYQDNTSSKQILINGLPTQIAGLFNTTFGNEAGKNLAVPAYDNCCFGRWSGRALTTGAGNTLCGSLTGYGMTTQNYNCFFGSGIGGTCTGTGNVVGGYYSGLYLTSADYNVMWGYNSGYNLTTGDSNIFFGYRSGYRQTTASNLLLISNQGHASAAAELTDSLIYGVFAAAVANQKLTFNAGYMGFFGTAAITKPAALTAANASALNTGDATSDTVIGNMRTRIGELESKLQALGLIT